MLRGNMANLVPINPANLGLFFANPLASGGWSAWELGTRDGSSPTEQHDPAATSATRTFLCYGNQIGNATVWFLGDSGVNEGNLPVTLTRRLPQQFPNNEKLIATGITISGHQSIGQTGYGNTTGASAPVGCLTIQNAYTMVKLEVRYTLEMYRADVTDSLIGAGLTEKDRYVSYPETTSAVEYGTMPAGMLNYIGISGSAGNMTPIPFSIGKIFPWQNFPVTWHRLPDAAWGESVSTYLMQRIYGNGTSVPYLGTVNKTSIFGKPAGTLLFEDVRAIHEASPVGDAGNIAGSNGWEWRLEYKFTFNPNQWNKLYYFAPLVADRPTKNGFYLVGANGTHFSAGNVPDNFSQYNEREFSNLFLIGNITPGP